MNNNIAAVWIFGLIASLLFTGVFSVVQFFWPDKDPNIINSEYFIGNGASPIKKYLLYDKSATAEWLMSCGEMKYALTITLAGEKGIIFDCNNGRMTRRGIK